MAWQATSDEMEAVLDGMRKTPLAERMGVIDGVMVKTFQVHADQRGYFLEQLKRGDHDDQGRAFLPEHGFAQMSRSLAYARGGNPPTRTKGPAFSTPAPRLLTRHGAA